jgi:hypothetical protein
MKYIFKIRNIETGTAVFSTTIEKDRRTFKDCKREALKKAWEEGLYKEDDNHIMTFQYS